ncbi:hypothetical protein NDU88_003505 [Pleurodeles waltl]|uniref:Uncharacterized protein n=1 Tax=Pleurodeles waltl TaxID=8319 RepID=A0AAV7KV22_PLEWA|nr:hypothetical protein NDU88_003505 [Pleurodeles waltl]
MRGRKPSTKLTPFWLKALLEGNGGVQECQQGARKHSNKIVPGDWVKIKSGRCIGGLNKFRGPFKVKDIGRWHVVLENGEKWNLGRVARFGVQGSKYGTQRSECEGSMLLEDEGVLSESQSYRKEGESGSLTFDDETARSIVGAPKNLDKSGMSTSRSSEDERVTISQTSEVESPQNIPEFEQSPGEGRLHSKEQRQRRPPLYLKDYVK